MRKSRGSQSLSPWTGGWEGEEDKSGEARREEGGGIGGREERRGEERRGEEKTGDERESKEGGEGGQRTKERRAIAADKRGRGLEGEEGEGGTTAHVVAQQVESERADGMRGGKEMVSRGTRGEKIEMP